MPPEQCQNENTAVQNIISHCEDTVSSEYSTIAEIARDLQLKKTPAWIHGASRSSKGMEQLKEYLAMMLTNLEQEDCFLIAI